MINIQDEIIFGIFNALSILALIAFGRWFDKHK